MSRPLLFITMIGFAAVPVAGADPAFAAKYEKVAPSAKLAEPIRKLLDDAALVVRYGDDVVMRVWFRSAIPVKATDEQIQNGLTYREIPEGTLVGAIEFPQAFTDFRRQEIPAGVYTLRFAVQPDIGDHTGTAPNPEFCLMCDATKDRAAEPMEKKDLISLSSEINDGKHPAVLLLFPNYGKDAGPKLADKGDSVWVVNTRRAVEAGSRKTSLGFAITVAGMWKP